MMKKLVLAALLLQSFVVNAAFIDFNSQLKATGTTTIPWVFGSTMWSEIVSSTGSGSDSEGFSSLDGLDLSKFTFSFGGLTLTSFLSPGPSSPGFERYTGATDPFEFFYDGQLWASGTVAYVQNDVANSTDLGGATSEITLTSAGVNDAFYNEMLALTDGTGTFIMTAGNFQQVDAFGLFSSTTSIVLPDLVVDPISAVSAPFGINAYAAILLCLVLARRHLLR